MDKSSPLFKAATWTPHVVCPACESIKCRTYGPRLLYESARVRYHQCKVCSALFKSVESVTTKQEAL